MQRWQPAIQTPHSVAPDRDVDQPRWSGHEALQFAQPCGASQNSLFYSPFAPTSNQSPAFFNGPTGFGGPDVMSWYGYSSHFMAGWSDPFASVNAMNIAQSSCGGGFGVQFFP